MEYKKISKKVFYIEVIVYLLLLYAICSNVFLNGDDFMYATFAKGSIFNDVKNYYFVGNGRFLINIVDSFLLLFDRYLYIVINPIIITIFIVLIAKNVQWILYKKANSVNEKELFRYGMVLFASLNILCLRETVFWITGMMNYLFPAVVFLLGILLFQQLRLSENIHWFKIFIYWIVCFIASFSVEQFALMFVGVQTLLFFVDLYGGNKSSNLKGLLVGYIISLIGLVLLIFAPGNFVRVEVQGESMPSFIENLWTLIYQNVVSDVALPYVIVLSICSSYFIFQNSKCKFLRFVAVFSPISLLLVSCTTFFEKAIILMLVIVCFAIQMIYVFIYMPYIEKKEIISLIIVGIGSQLMMLISAIWGYRCMFSMYMIYMILILFIISKFGEKYRWLLLAIASILSLNPYLLIICLCIYFLFFKRNEAKYIGIRIATYVSTILLLIVLFNGYFANVNIYLDNIYNAENYNGTDKIIVQNLKNEKYSWYTTPFNDFHEKYYKQYYGVSDDTIIVYEEVH